MNLYFLVEGQTEARLYPRWLKYLLPDFKRVKSFRKADYMNYYLFSAGGFPGIVHKHLSNAVREVNEAGNYDYLIMCFDADENTVAQREDEVVRALERKNLYLENTQLMLVIQNCCIETWLLGNRNLYSRNNGHRELKKYIQFYDIIHRDPEKMGKPKGYAKPIQQFHFEYLIKLCRHNAIRYRKGHPYGVTEEEYLRELEYRVTDTNHLSSFEHFRNFCLSISEQVK